jgi:hypothetical protein
MHLSTCSLSLSPSCKQAFIALCWLGGGTSASSTCVRSIVHRTNRFRGRFRSFRVISHRTSSRRSTSLRTYRCCCDVLWIIGRLEPSGVVTPLWRTMETRFFFSNCDALTLTLTITHSLALSLSRYLAISVCVSLCPFLLFSLYAYLSASLTMHSLAPYCEPLWRLRVIVVLRCSLSLL